MTTAFLPFFVRVCRRVLSAGALAAALHAVAHAQQPAPASKLDGPAAMLYSHAQVLTLMRSGPPPELDAFVDRLAISRSRFEDGRWQLAGVDFAWGRIFANVNDWDAAHATLAEWRRKSPDSPAAPIAEAKYWISYAWNARGSGYTHSVPADAWPLFRERLRRGEAVLIQSKAYASRNPLWYSTYLEIARGLAWPHAEQLQLFREAVQREPRFHLHYFAIVNSMMPKWGGSYELVARIADDAVQRTSAEDGESMYARIYWLLAQTEGEDLDIFRDAGASWERMKRGFEDLLARYPDSRWNLTNFASFACRAQDKATYVRLRPKINPTVHREAWPSNSSIDLCDRRFLGRT